MENQISKKGLSNSDPDTWRIKPHWNIPQEVIDLTMKTKGFQIRVVKAAAERYFERIVWGLNRSGVPAALVDPQLYRTEAQQSLASLPVHPSVWTLGTIIEKFIVADKLEAWLRVNPISITKKKR